MGTVWLVSTQTIALQAADMPSASSRRYANVKTTDEMCTM